MKKVVLASMLVFASLTANADDPNSNEKLLGAVAGGYLGSTIGGGDGKTVATVLGAIVGYNLGPKVLGENNHHHHNYRGHYRRPQWRQADIYSICKSRNPYPDDSRFFWSYNQGCVQRLSEQMREMERYAYEQGYQGN